MLIRKDFIEISKNLIRYKFENNFVRPINQNNVRNEELKNDEQCCKKF